MLVERQLEVTWLQRVGAVLSESALDVLVPHVLWYLNGVDAILLHFDSTSQYVLTLTNTCSTL